jgi:hypothetical protein
MAKNDRGCVGPGRQEPSARTRENAYFTVSCAATECDRDRASASKTLSQSDIFAAGRRRFRVKDPQIDACND